MSIGMLNVVMLNVFMLNVVAPNKQFTSEQKAKRKNCDAAGFEKIGCFDKKKF
jgi:hypothetical protein